MCGGKPSAPKQAEQAEIVVPDMKQVDMTATEARNKNRQRLLAAGYQRNVFTSPMGATLTPTSKAALFGQVGGAGG